MALAVAPSARAEDTSIRLGAWQEIVVLTIAKAHHAADTCGFKVDAGRVGALLGAAALDDRDIPPGALSSSMRRQIGADADQYLGDRDAACGRAWDRFGPDGAIGVRDLLTR